MDKRELKIIYIAGNGHSGSTLLDIILSSAEGCFSAGELTNITRDSIMQEYCSCKKNNSQCEIWADVIKKWVHSMGLPFEEFKELRLKFERNKSSIWSFRNKIFPSKEFDKYCLATKKLFEIVQDITGKNIIIDSSKSPQRIAVLQRIFDVHVLHICRDFSGVMNSGKKFTSKNIKAGVEADIYPRRTGKILFDWIVTNFLTVIFSAGVCRTKIKYNTLVSNPDAVFDKVNIFSLKYNGLLNKAFYAEHMLAGNMLRLKRPIRINPTIGKKHSNIDNKQKLLGIIIDRMFFFWSRTQ